MRRNAGFIATLRLQPCMVLALLVVGAPAQAMKLVVRAPAQAGKGQEALLAWVASPVAGAACRWEIQGGEFQSPPDREWVLFKAGTGDLVSLTCWAEAQGRIAGVGHQALATRAEPQVPEFAFDIQVPGMGIKGRELAAQVVEPDNGRFAYQWIVDGRLQGARGSQAALAAGTQDRVRVACLAIDRKSGAREMVQRDVELAEPLEEPKVHLPERIYEGWPVTATVTNPPPGNACSCQWKVSPAEAVKELVEDQIPGDTGRFTFLAPPGGTRFQLTCTFENLFTQEQRHWTATLDALARPSLAPARFTSIRLDPEGPLSRNQGSLALHWSLDRQPDRLLLRDEATGREHALDPSVRSCNIQGPFQGRRKFSLVAARTHPETKETVRDVRTVDIVVPGVRVLAGDVENVGAAYMREGTQGARPWGTVTGLAWKAPWLYIAEGEQHTVRRIRSCAGDFEVEEVAGMRGLPGTGRPGEDRLSRPGQLVPRCYRPAGGKPIEEWLVLQPEARCIQAFREGLVQDSMRVLVGAFTLPPSTKAKPSRGLETKGEPAQADSCLKAPVAMAAHPGTGHVLVADHGHRNLMLFAPEEAWCQVLVRGVEAGGVAMNRRGDVFYSEPAQHVVRVLRRLGTDRSGRPVYDRPEVFAGAEGQAGAIDGDRTGKARFWHPRDLSVDHSGSNDLDSGDRKDLESGDPEHLLIADSGNHLVRRILADPARPQDVETVGGNVDLVSAGRELLPAHPSGIDAVLDPSTGDIHLFAQATGNVHTVPGSADSKAGGAVLDTKGNLFVSDPAQHVVMVQRLMGGSPGQTPEYAAPEVFAGTPGCSGRREGPRLAPVAVATAGAPGKDGGKDEGKDEGKDGGTESTSRAASRSETKRPSRARVRTADPKSGSRTGARFAEPGALALDPKDSHFLLVTDLGNQAIWRIPLDLEVMGEAKEYRKTTGQSLPAGAGGYADGPRVSSRFDAPGPLCGDGNGRVFVLDQTGGSRQPVIRRIDLDGRASTLGGSGADASLRLAGEAGFNAPAGIGVDRAGNIYVADGRNRCIRRIGLDGKLVVVAGTRRAPEFSAADDQAPETSAFHHLGFLGVDGLGRVVVTEPERPRLRLVEFGSGDAKGLVATLRDGQPHRLLSIFPALAPVARNYLFVTARPSEGNQGHVLSVFRLPGNDGQVVDDKVHLQALCCDRSNRICAVLQPDPEQPGAIQIHRYRFVSPGSAAPPETKRKAETKGKDETKGKPGGETKEPPAAAEAPRWIKESATLTPAAVTRPAQIDGRPYAPCGLPRIVGMAAGSHGDLYLADAGNGVIWHVPENLEGIERVAGRYPFLGPVGGGFDDPLPPMQGIAVTPDDDLVVTSGNAVLQVTLAQRRAPAAWRLAPAEPWTLPRRQEAKAARTGPTAPRLKDEKLENIWRLAQAAGQKALDQAREVLHSAKLRQRIAELNLAKKPQAMELKATLENLVPVLAAAERDHAFRTAEVAAKEAAYAYLLMKVGLPGDPPAPRPAVSEAVAKADSMAKQARCEYLALARTLALQGRSGTPPEADRLRLAYLEAIRSANQAVVDLADRTGAPAAAGRGARAGLAQPRGQAPPQDGLKPLQDAVGKASEAIRAFNKQRGEEAIPEFRPWITPVESKYPEPLI